MYLCMSHVQEGATSQRGELICLRSLNVYMAEPGYEDMRIWTKTPSGRQRNTRTVTEVCRL